MCAQRRGGVVVAGPVEVRDQTPAGGQVVPEDDHGPAYPRMLGERGLDLTRFDPYPAELHLVVDPAEELQAPVLAQAHQVTGPVHPPTRRAPYGSGRKRSAVSAGPRW